MSTMESIESVRVFTRCRPLLPQEIQDQAISIVKVNHVRSEVSITNPKAPSSEDPKTFSFDGVFNSQTSQKAIYIQAAFPIINSVLQGYNGTIFASGQTGAGKTYTMQGIPGIIPRAFEHIFDHIEITLDKHFLVRVSFFEIFNEEVHDLLNKDPGNKLKVREKPGSGFYIEGLLSLPVESAADASQKLVTGNQNREVRLIRTGQKSSRSHLIFSITVECYKTGPDGKTHVKMGKLNLVDLAASEAVNEKKSLIALRDVTSALTNQESVHIPYRDSKLTMLLQDSLGGNTKTVMIANIGPADWDYEETLHTLRFASQVKLIKNKPRVNEYPKDAFLRMFQEDIQKLKAQLEKEKEEIFQMIETEKSLPDAERQRLLGDFAKREEAQCADREQEEREKSKKELQEKRLFQQKSPEHLCRGRFRNIQPELEGKGKNISKLSFKIEKQEAQGNFDEERASYQEQIYALNSQLKLKDLVIHSFIPQDIVTKIETESIWDEQEEDWILPNINFSQESLKRPESSLGSTRPTSSYSRRSLFSSSSYWNGRRSSHIKGGLKIGTGQDEGDLEDMNELNGLNLSDSDLEEEKEDYCKVDEKTRKIISGSKRVKSGRKREEKSSNREEEKCTISLFEEDF